MNKFGYLTLCMTLGLSLTLLSMPLYSDENTAQTTSGDTTAGEGTADKMTTTPEEASVAPDTPAAPPQSKHVLRALLTSGIENREPMDEIVSIDKNRDRIYFFTEFTDLKGKSIKHSWEFNGKSMGEVNFIVGSNKWRCYSSKNLLPEWTGIWTVSVVDEKNNVLAETYFEVTE